MANENITTKFKIDISDLKAGISEANKQIKLANAQFKAAAAGMDDWGKSSQGIEAKLKQLSTVLDAQKSKLNSYKSQLEAQKSAYDENGKRADQLRTKLTELADQGVSKTSDEYKKYKQALTEVEKEQASNQKAIDDLNVSILNQQGTVNGIEKDIRNYQNALDDLNTSEAKAAEEAKQSANAYNTLKSTISNQEKQLEDLKKEYANVVLEQGKNSDSAKELAGQIDNLSSELNENRSKLQEVDKAADDLDESLDEAGDSANSAASGGFTVLKGAIASLVADAIKAGISALKEFAQEVVKVGMDFDSSMSQVAAVSGATGDELESLRDKAKEMGASTKFTASEAADAFNYMAMAGWKTEDMLSGIDGILALAAAGNTDLATTSDIVTDALTAFGATAADAGRLADIMAAASSNANTNVEMMGETFKYVAPVAGAMGYSMEDTSVAIGLMANAGIKATQAGTSLRSILSRLAAPPKAAADAMTALGISITNADGTMKPMSEVIGILREKFDGLSEAEQTQYAKALAGQEAMSGLLAIVNAAPEDVDKLTTAINNSAGAAAEMAEVMQDNLSGDLTKLGSQFEGVQLSIYEAFEPALRSGVSALSDMTSALGDYVTAMTNGNTTGAAQNLADGIINALTSAYESFKDNIPMIAQEGTNLIMAIVEVIIGSLPLLIDAGVKMIGGILSGIGQSLPSIVQTVISIIPQIIQGLMNGLPALIQGAITLLMGIVDAIPVAVEAIMQALPQIVNALIDGLVTGIPALINGALQLLMAIVDAIPRIIPIIVENLPQIINSIVVGLTNGLGAIIQGATQLLTGIIQAIPILIEALIPEIPIIITTIVDVLVQNIPVLLEGAIRLFMALVEAIPTICMELLKAIPQIIDAIFEGLGDLPDMLGEFFTGVWNGIQNIFAPVGEWFGELFTRAWEGVQNIWDTVAQWFNDYVVEPIKRFFEPLITFFTELWTVISGLAKGTWEIIKRVWEIVGTWFDQNVITPVKNFFTTLWDGISNAASNAWDAIKRVWTIVSEWFNENIVSPVANFFNGMWDGIKTAASDAWEGIKSIFKPVADWFEEKFSTAWTAVKNVFSTGGKIFDGIKDGIVAAFKAVVNAIIKGINKVIATPFNAINGVLNTIRDIQILDFKPFSGLWKKNPLSVPQIPLLARGGVLAKGQMGLLEGSGAEAVVPLENNKKWIRAVAADLLNQLKADAGNNINTNNSSNSNYNFTQVINAPKQPSRIELYRQTRNLLAYAKGVT